MCLCVHDTVHLWRSEDNLEEKYPFLPKLPKDFWLCWGHFPLVPYVENLETVWSSEGYSVKRGDWRVLKCDVTVVGNIYFVSHKWHQLQVSLGPLPPGTKLASHLPWEERRSGSLFMYTWLSLKREKKNTLEHAGGMFLMNSIVNPSLPNQGLSRV